MTPKFSMTQKRQRFIHEYLVDLCGSKAAIRAGYSKDAAGQIACGLLALPEIKEAIQREMDARSQRTQVTADRVLEEIAKIAFYNPGRVIRSDSNGLPAIDLTAATEDDFRVIAEVSNESVPRRDPDNPENYITVTKAKIKHHDKLSALDKLMKHLGMNAPEKIEVEDVSGLTDAERARRTLALLDRARTRRDGSAAETE